MVTHNRLLLALIFFNALFIANVSLATPPQGFENEGKKSIFDVLYGNEILNLTIKTDLNNLIENRRTEEFLEATFGYEDASGRQITRSIEVQPRGKFRRRICDFPPVKIKFSKDDLEASGLIKKFNDLKLVTHCIDDKLIGNENLLKEYLVYRMYNELTPNSYRIQLVKITYEDTKGNLSKIKRYGFLIEDTDEMAARLGGEEFEQMNVSTDSISAKDEAIMALFQYMIGNADWSTVMLRNVKLVLPENSDKMIPVPYDFDFAGLINASYAVPQGDLGLTSIRDRLYLGNKTNPEAMRNTLGYFYAKKEILLDMVKSFDMLSNECRGDLILYLETFYSTIKPVVIDPSIDIKAFWGLKNANIEAFRAWEASQKQGQISNGSGKK
ncbi:MAG: hypothetical protein SFU99_11805 [Saprospiraceae bacterium]|nr:hypothetical protein [Saprospiraceae bacterium]